jgi:hypothetical protein
MHAQRAAPGLAPGTAAGSDSTGDTGSDDRGPESITALGLEPHLVERLILNEIRTAADWLALGRQRFKLWGVTRRHVKLIDEAIAAAQHCRCPRA